MQTLKLVCGLGRGVRQLENTNFWKSFQYFDTKFGQCLYLDIFYLLRSLFCSLKSYFLILEHRLKIFVRLSPL